MKILDVWKHLAKDVNKVKCLVVIKPSKKGWVMIFMHFHDIFQVHLSNLLIGKLLAELASLWFVNLNQKKTFVWLFFLTIVVQWVEEFHLIQN